MALGSSQNLVSQRLSLGAQTKPVARIGEASAGAVELWRHVQRNAIGGGGRLGLAEFEKRLSKPEMNRRLVVLKGYRVEQGIGGLAVSAADMVDRAEACQGGGALRVDFEGCGICLLGPLPALQFDEGAAQCDLDVGPVRYSLGGFLKVC